MAYVRLSMCKLICSECEKSVQLTSLQCGHCLCRSCVELLAECPTCHEKITAAAKNTFVVLKETYKISSDIIRNPCNIHHNYSLSRRCSCGEECCIECFSSEHFGPGHQMMETPKSTVEKGKELPSKLNIDTICDIAVLLLYEFFHDDIGLSATTAQRYADKAVALDVANPKKLAKLIRNNNEYLDVFEMDGLDKDSVQNYVNSEDCARKYFRKRRVHIDDENYNALYDDDLTTSDDHNDVLSSHNYISSSASSWGHKPRYPCNNSKKCTQSSDLRQLRLQEVEEVYVHDDDDNNNYNNNNEDSDQDSKNSDEEDHCQSHSQSQPHSQSQSLSDTSKVKRRRTSGVDNLQCCLKEPQSALLTTTRHDRHARHQRFSQLDESHLLRINVISQPATLTSPRPRAARAKTACKDEKDIHVMKEEEKEEEEDHDDEKDCPSFLWAQVRQRFPRQRYIIRDSRLGLTATSLLGTSRKFKAMDQYYLFKWENKEWSWGKLLRECTNRDRQQNLKFMCRMHNDKLEQKFGCDVSDYMSSSDDEVEEPAGTWCILQKQTDF